MLETISLALLALGCLAGAAGAWVKNWTALALLASTIFSTILCEMGVPFRPSLNLAIDMVVIIWIAIGWANAVAHGEYGRARDIPILVLFTPIWALYFIDVSWRSYAIDILITIQLLLTFPIRRVLGWSRRVRDDNPHDGQMRRAVA